MEALEGEILANSWMVKFRLSKFHLQNFLTVHGTPSAVHYRFPQIKSPHYDQGRRKVKVMCKCFIITTVTLVDMYDGKFVVSSVILLIAVLVCYNLKSSGL